MEFPEPRSIDEIVATGYRVRVWAYLREAWRVFSFWPVGFLGIAFSARCIDDIFGTLVPYAWPVGGIVLNSIIPASLVLATWQVLRREQPQLPTLFPGWQRVFRLVPCAFLLLSAEGALAGWVLGTIGVASMIVPIVVGTAWESIISGGIFMVLFGLFYTAVFSLVVVAIAVVLVVVATLLPLQLPVDNRPEPETPCGTEI